MEKLRNTILSPIFTPGVFNKPAGLSISDVPSDNLYSLSSWESLISWVNLINTFFINEEISVNRNYGNDWAVIENFLLNILHFFWNAVISNFMFLASCGFLLTLFWSLRAWTVSKTFLVNQSIYFCIIKSSWNITSSALVVNGFITGQRSLRGQ